MQRSKRTNTTFEFLRNRIPRPHALRTRSKSPPTRTSITDNNANVDIDVSTASDTAPDADPGQGDRLLQAKAARQHQHDLAVHTKESTVIPKTVTKICRRNQIEKVGNTNALVIESLPAMRTVQVYC